MAFELIPLPYDRDALAPAISADGSTVAFESQASNLVPKDTNKARDIFARVPAH